MAATRGIESILNDRRILDWGNGILKFEPESTPLVVISKLLGKEPAKNQVYIDFEDRPLTRLMYLSDFTDGGGDSATIQIDDGSGTDMGGNIYVGDLLYDVTVEDFMWVTAITRGAPDTITVVYNYSDQGTNNMTAATQSGKTFDVADTTDSGIAGHADNDRILKVSTTFEDGGISSNAKAKDMEKIFNFCQKFQTSYSVDRETMMSELNGEPELKRLQARMAIEHLKDIEYQFLFGKKDARVYEGTRSDSAGKYIYTTGGLYHSGMGSDDIAVPLTETAMRSFLRAGGRYGSNRKLLLLGGLIKEGLDVWSMGRLVTKAGDSKTGLDIVEYIMAGKVFNIVTHPLLEDDFEGIGFCLDTNLLKYKTFDDTKLQTGIQANDAQERKDQFLTQVGQKMGLIEHHRRMKGVESIAG